MKRKAKLTKYQKMTKTDTQETTQASPNLLVKIFRFFFPKDFKAELLKGRMIGEQIREGKLTPKMMPTWWIGKAIRKIIDPKHKMKFKEKTREDHLKAYILEIKKEKK